MVIREAKRIELSEIMAFYDLMCEALGKMDYLPEGNKGGFPPPDMVTSAIADGQLYIGEEDHTVMVAYILNHSADPAYDTVSWQIDAPREQVSILHALRVHPA